MIKVNINKTLYVKYKEGGGCMGCTLIKSTFFHIPFVIKTIIVSGVTITSEDYPFFINVAQNNGLCLYVENHDVKHLQI